MAQRLEILQSPIDSLTMDEAVEWLRTRAGDGRRANVVIAMNAAKLWRMNRESELDRVIRTADLLIPERAFLFAARVLGTPIADHVGGVTLVRRFLPIAARDRIRLYFLGATDRVVQRLVQRLRRQHPALVVAGYRHGYFTREQETDVIASIREARPQVLFVALGTPKQELWMDRNRNVLGVPVLMGVGGSFDVLAGIKSDAPHWVRLLYMEWLYRLALDPRNLWKRYLMTIPWFLYRVLAARLSRELSVGSRAAWYWWRLRAMSPAEMPYRIAQSARTWLERTVENPYHVPEELERIGFPVELGPGLLAGATGLRRPTPAAADRLLGEAERVLVGEIALFGRWCRIELPIAWHREPETGRSWPAVPSHRLDFRRGGARQIWELGRMRHAVVLAQGYRLTSGEELAARAIADVTGFVGANPPLQGVHWTSALEVGLRLLAWAWVWECTLDSRAWEPTAVRLLARGVWQHARFVERHLSRYSSANNHLIGEATGLLAAGLAFRGLAGAERWVRLGSRILEEEVRKQFTGEGGCREQAWNYHVFDLELLTTAGSAARAHGQPLSTWFDERVGQIAGFLRKVGGTPVRFPMIGDSDEARAPGTPLEVDDLEASVAAGECYASACVDAARHASSAWGVWLTGHDHRLSPSTDRSHAGAAGPRPDVVVQLHESGYVVGHGLLPQSPAKVRVIFDVGPLGFLRLASHGHADALSVWVSAGDRELFRDSGTYLYTDDPEARRFFRGTSAHNTVTVGGRDQSEQAGPSLWRTRADAELVSFESNEEGWTALGRHAGYERREGVLHERRVTYVQGLGLVIVDTVGSRRPQALPEVRLHWHATDPVQETNWGGVLCDGRAGPGAQFLSACLTGQELTCAWVRGAQAPLQGWWSVRYGERAPAPTFVARVAGGKRALLVTVLLFGPAAASPIVALATDNGGVSWEQEAGSGSLQVRDDGWVSIRCVPSFGRSQEIVWPHGKQRA